MRRPGDDRDLLQAFELPGRPTGPIAIEHVTVIPMDREIRLEDHTVLIEDGTIVALGPAFAAPPAPHRVDGRGLFLMPGLADMHVHWWDLGDHALYLANGVTSVRNMWGAPMHLALRQRIGAREFPGPHLTTTSPIVDGPGPSGRTVWPNSPMVREGDDPAALVQGFAARGYQQVKVYSWLGPQAHRAVCASAARAALPVTGHCPDRLTFEQAIANGQRCFEHLQAIRNGHFPPDVRTPVPSDRTNRVALARLTAERLDLDAIRRLAHQMARGDIWNCPTAVVWQQMARERGESLKDPELRYMSEATIATWDPKEDFRFRDIKHTGEEYRSAMNAQIEMYMRVLGILHEEGAPLLLGTDTPNPFVIPGFSIHRELANLRRAGLSPYEALRAGTAEAARSLGEAAEWGTVSVGKRADLLLLREDPLADVGALRSLQAVAVNGYWLDRAELDRMLSRRIRSLREAPTVSAALDPSPDAALREGALRELVTGAEVGRIVFRHGHARDGLRVEERYAIGHGRGTGQRRTVTLDLAPDFTIRSGTVVTEVPLGTERVHIEASPGRTVVRTDEIDGHRGEVVFAGSLAPSERLSTTAVAAFLGSRERAQVSVPVLSIDATGPAALTLLATPGEGPTWSVTIERTGELTAQTYTLGPEGALERLDEVTFRGKRSLEAEGGAAS